jgi:hypothetical protein
VVNIAEIIKWLQFIFQTTHFLEGQEALSILDYQKTNYLYVDCVFSERNTVCV